MAVPGGDSGTMNLLMLSASVIYTVKPRWFWDGLGNYEGKLLILLHDPVWLSILPGTLMSIRALRLH